MPFYPPRYRREPFQMTKQRFRPFAPTQARESYPFFTPMTPFRGENSFNRVAARPYVNPYEQPRAPMDLHAMMGHVGTVTNGINMMRQLGGIISLFK